MPEPLDRHGAARIRVPNGGNPRAQLFILGEAPGAKEEEQLKPFVGPSGILLFKLLLVVGLSREDVFLANVVQFRPTIDTASGKKKDRKPTAEEIEQDGRVFERDLARVRPAVVLSLGVTAAEALGLDVSHGLTGLRATVNRFGSSLVVPTFHPGYALRNAVAKDQLLADIRLCARQANLGKAA